MPHIAESTTIAGRGEHGASSSARAIWPHTGCGHTKEILSVLLDRTHQVLALLCAVAHARQVLLYKYFSLRA